MTVPPARGESRTSEGSVKRLFAPTGDEASLRFTPDATPRASLGPTQRGRSHLPTGNRLRPGAGARKLSGRVPGSSRRGFRGRPPEPPPTENGGQPRSPLGTLDVDLQEISRHRGTRRCQPPVTSSSRYRPRRARSLTVFP